MTSPKCGHRFEFADFFAVGLKPLILAQFSDFFLGDRLRLYLKFPQKELLSIGVGLLVAISRSLLGEGMSVGSDGIRGTEIVQKSLN